MSVQVFYPLIYIFLTRLLVFFLLSFKSSLDILDDTRLSVFLRKYVFPICGLSFHCLDFCRVEAFNFNKVQLVNYLSQIYHKNQLRLDHTNLNMERKTLNS